MCGLYMIVAKYLKENSKYSENLVIFIILSPGTHKKAFTTDFRKASDFEMQNTLEKFVCIRPCKVRTKILGGNFQILRRYRFFA